METFTAFRIHSDDGKTVEPRIETLSLDDLSAGEVVIRGEWSGINYKDALAATGAGKIQRSFPLVGGVDIAGTVVSSVDARLSAGDPVVVTGAGLSETRDGGFAGYARVPAEATVRLPDGISTRDAMAIGTAGFTAALAVHRMEHNGQSPDLGRVAVTGATGGVGSVAIDLLAGRGYKVTAVSRKNTGWEYLTGLGAMDVLTVDAIDMGTRPLEKAIWAGAVDNVGGELLAWLTRTVKPCGNIASIGLAGGIKLETTVMPFILRGVSLLGINSVDVPLELRRQVWDRLAGDLKPSHLDAMVTAEVGLDELAGCFQPYIDGTVTGRTLVRLAD